jgi:hypothetical protein
MAEERRRPTLVEALCDDPEFRKLVDEVGWDNPEFRKLVHDIFLDELTTGTMINKHGQIVPAFECRVIRQRNADGTEEELEQWRSRMQEDAPGEG